MTTKQESLESIKNDVMRSRKIGNNTFEVIYKDGNRAIRLHKTDIITFWPTLFSLNTGGWDTVTTKARLNKYMPHHSVYIFQRQYTWYVSTDKGEVEYYDGMRFNYTGTLIE